MGIDGEEITWRGTFVNSSEECKGGGLYACYPYAQTYAPPGEFGRKFASIDKTPVDSPRAQRDLNIAFDRANPTPGS